MARPKTGKKGRNTTLYLDLETFKALQKHAFKLGTSVSEIVNRLMVAELSTDGGIACRHTRRPSVKY
jgi:hypothetical protein